MNVYSSLSTTTPSVSRMIAMLAYARKFPLRVTCIGQAHYSEDASSDFCVPRTVVLGEYSSLINAMTFIKGLVREGHVAIRDDSVISFSPRLFTVRDDEDCLVIAGEVGSQDINWCDPVASDGEARSVIEAASRLRGQVFRATQSDNHAATHALCFRAAALEGRLVHPDWREQARSAVQFFSEGARCHA